MMTQLDSDGLSSFTKDTEYYLLAAEAIEQNANFQTYGVFLFGPGYPLILAVLGLLVGHHPVLILIFQIIISSITSVLMVRLALRLTEEKTIAFIVGIVNAISLTSISLANTILSETIFMFLVVVGFLLFEKALKTKRIADYILCAVIIAFSVITRSMGQFLFLILLVMAVGYYLQKNWPGSISFFRQLLWPAITMFVIVLVVLTMSMRNNALYDLPVVAASGPIGIAKLAWRADGELKGTNYTEAYQRFMANVENRANAPDVNFEYTHFYPVVSPDGPKAKEFNQIFLKHTKILIERLIKEQPVVTFSVFLAGVREGIINIWGMQYYQFPKWNEGLRNFTSLLNKKGFHYCIPIMSLIGALMLLKRQKYRLLSVLVVIYLYFASISSFTMWQSTRIFYPGQIAWAILIAYPIRELYLITNLKISKYMQRKISK